jgi:hypothetical protein
MLVGTDSVSAQHHYQATVLRKTFRTARPRSPRPSVTRAAIAVAVLVAGSGAYVGIDGARAQAAFGTVDVSAPLLDPGPPWTPDYGLMCEILERYGNASADVCPLEPLTSMSGPR